VRTRAAVVVGPRAHPRHFRTPANAAPVRGRRERKAVRASEAWEGWLVTWAGPIQRSRFDQGEVRAHRGVNPGTRLLFTATSRCRSTPDLFHAFPKNGAETLKTQHRTSSRNSCETRNAVKSSVDWTDDVGASTGFPLLRKLHNPGATRFPRMTGMVRNARSACTRQRNHRLTGACRIAARSINTSPISNAWLPEFRGAPHPAPCLPPPGY
jgi:hypothetical protein